jgi:hypothetical protein
MHVVHAIGRISRPHLPLVCVISVLPLCVCVRMCVRMCASSAVAESATCGLPGGCDGCAHAVCASVRACAHALRNPIDEALLLSVALQVATRVGEPAPAYMLLHLDDFLYDVDNTGDRCASCMREFSADSPGNNAYACEQYCMNP